MVKQFADLKFIAFKKLVLNFLENLQGQDIVCFDMHNKNSITDLMILCTGRSKNHVVSIGQDIIRKLKHVGLQYHGIEGIKFGEWVLIDLGDIVVHIMKKETRNLYELEKLWR